MKVFLNVCDDKPHVMIEGQRYVAGFRGEVPIKHSVDADSDILTLDLTECGHRPSVGDASRIEALSVRICANAVTTIAIYDDPSMNTMGCCHCCPNGCCVYGSSGCGCG